VATVGMSACLSRTGIVVLYRNGESYGHEIFTDKGSQDSNSN